VKTRHTSTFGLSVVPCAGADSFPEVSPVDTPRKARFAWIAIGALIDLTALMTGAVIGDRGGRGPIASPALLLLIGMKLGFLGRGIFDHLTDPSNRQLICDRARQSPILL
jgi:hypothetical protein